MGRAGRSHRRPAHGAWRARPARRVAISAFSLTQDEAGLFAVSAAFGFGFAGIIPAYSVAIRDLFPPSEASWRMPLTLFTAMSGMAFGSWFAGLLYDHFGYYAPAFTTGIVFNIANLRSSASWSCASPADGGSIPMPPSA